MKRWTVTQGDWWLPADSPLWTDDEVVEDEVGARGGGVLGGRDGDGDGVDAARGGVGLLLLEEPRGVVSVERVDGDPVDRDGGDADVPLLDIGKGQRAAVKAQAHAGTGLVAVLDAATGVRG